MRDDDFEMPSAGKVFGSIIKWGVILIAALFFLNLFTGILGFGGWLVSRPAATAVGVVNRIMDPDAALENYRWFRDAYNAYQGQQQNIDAARRALTYAEQHAPDRASAREVELTGAVQTCNNLVAEYNSRAERIDSRLFMDPHQFFTGLVDGHEATPIPTHLEYTPCRQN